MPQEFKDFDSMRSIQRTLGGQYAFREPLEGEEEETYRAALAAHLKPHDLVLSMEIETKGGRLAMQRAMLMHMAEKDPKSVLELMRHKEGFE